MEELKINAAQLAAMANAKVQADASGNVTISAASLQRIYDHINQAEKDARAVAAEYRRFLYMRAAGEVLPITSLINISKASYRIADDSMQAVIVLQLAAPFVGDPFKLNPVAQLEHSSENCACCRDLVYLTAARAHPAPAPAADEGEDLYA